jgi:GNAT superfamily N-acetyltransferase
MLQPVPSHSPAGRELTFARSRTILHEPRSLYAQFFLATDLALQRLGVRLTEVPFATLGEVYKAHADTWNGLPPWFDADGHDIDPATSMAFVGFDATGAAVCAGAVQLWDFAGRTLRERFEDLSLLFGANAPARRGHWRAEAAAPIAAELTGRVIYGGGYWVRPDWRGKGIGSLMPAAVRYTAFARWDAGVSLTLGGRAFLASELRDFYDYTDCQDGMLIMDGDRVVFRGLLVWGRTAHSVDRLRPRLAALRAATSTFGDGRQGEPLAVVAQDRNTNP